MKVVNIGSLNYDYTYSMDHIILPGETQASTGMETFCGGKGLNQSIALAKAGVPVFHGGMVGEDGDRLKQECLKYGVDTKYIKTIPGKSGHTIIQVDKNAQNSIILFGGANRSMTREWVDEILKDFEAGDILLLQNEINELDYVIEQAYQKKMTIVLNPSPYDKNLEPCDFGKISIFLMNEIEGEQMTSEKEPTKILEKMRATYPDSKVVLTLGKDGAIYQDGEKQWKQDIFKVQAVDTTAAGDTFTGYFIAGLLEGLEPQEILKRSAKASSIAVTRKGAVASIPEKEEVLRQISVQQSSY